MAAAYGCCAAGRLLGHYADRRGTVLGICRAEEAASARIIIGNRLWSAGSRDALADKLSAAPAFAAARQPSGPVNLSLALLPASVYTHSGSSHGL
ncbi:MULTISPECIES: hypothetical protein [Sphingobacterium]|uniref:hypothetical protein n=1 Tax=Sphingobacterium TaxID=28453 RepID=UPI00257D3E36|nr:MULTISPECIES: hypothetical protein [Sphingobacterium]